MIFFDFLRYQDRALGQRGGRGYFGCSLLGIGLLFLLLLLPISALGAPGDDAAGRPGVVAELPPPVENIDRLEKCPVCGMFVSRYPEWISQLHLDGDEVHHFDGMKDLLIYHFQPEQFGGRTNRQVRAIWAKDYYTLQWVEARRAWFVVGSTVYGPMGHEFVPLASREAAEAFMRDHQGEEILRFDEITLDRVQSKRTGHRMGR